MSLQKIGEFALISALSKSLSLSKNVIKGIGDDTAVLPLNKSKYLLLTTDMLVQDVHFTRKAAPEMIGHKALACNISDIAAMGGMPTHAVVSIGLSKHCSTEFVKKVYAGINSLARNFQVGIVGGDTVRARQFVINIALLGEVEKKNLVLRSGAGDGDWIWVTGPLGRAWKTDKHLSFTPRVAEARFLVSRFKPSAMIDVSDGLAGDLGHILEQSRVGAVLFDDQLPLNKGASLRDALYDGEDFELAFTMNPAKAKKLMEWQERKQRWFFYPIGRITNSKGLKLLGKDGREKKLEIKGFTHF